MPGNTSNAINTGMTELSNRRTAHLRKKNGNLKLADVKRIAREAGIIKDQLYNNWDKNINADCINY